MSAEKLIARWNGFYALSLYIPFSAFARSYRAFVGRLRGKQSRFLQVTKLPEASWHQVLSSRPVHVVEARKANGNVRISELGVLAKAAGEVAAGQSIVEIGTFDGRTTLNLAVNSGPDTKVFTLDLPPEVPTKFDLAKGERHFVEKPQPGARYRNCHAPWDASAKRITQLLGDSAAFDWSPYTGTAGLVFVDGSHAYDYAMADTETAFKLIAPGGIVIWHDYGVWEGVTKALEELEEKRQLGLKKIYGTSLVFWRSP